jgi:cyclase
MASIKSRASHLPIAGMVLGAVMCLNCPSRMMAAPETGDGQEIRKTVIADGIYQFTTLNDSYVEQLNSVVVVNERDVLVFDTNTRPSSARAILSEIRKITDKPVRYLVNSHHHPDHWSGNEVYAQAFGGLQIIATEQAREFMINIANMWAPRFSAQIKRARAAYDKAVSSGKQEDGSPLTEEQRRTAEADLRGQQSLLDETLKVHRTLPTLTYVDKLTMYDGGREFRFISVFGDAAGTTILYLPKERVVMTGDLIVLPFPSTNHVGKRIKVLQDLARLDVDIIIPGHGAALYDKSRVNLEIEFLQSVQGQVDGARLQGVDSLALEDILKVVNVDAFRAKFTHGDKDLVDSFNGYLRGVVGQATREVRGQEFNQ